MSTEGEQVRAAPVLGRLTGSCCSGAARDSGIPTTVASAISISIFPSSAISSMSSTLCQLLQCVDDVRICNAGVIVETTFESHGLPCVSCMINIV